MPPVRYYNQTAPFWDFVASLEEQSSSHPFFAGNSNRGEATNNEHSDEHEHEHGEPAGPWAGAWGPWGPFAHRGRHGPPPPGPPPHHHGGPPPHHRGGPPPHHHDGPPPPPPPADGETDGEAGPSDPPEMSPEDLTGPYHGPGSHGHGRHGRRGGPHGARGRADRCGRGRRGGFPPGMGALGPFGPFAEVIQAQIQNSFFGGEQNEGSSDDFKPEVDVFDTTEAFVVHVSLPGAKKEDIGVNWVAEKSELNIAGVIHRPGDEDFLKTLALNERRVGAFERNVRLGSRANPAQVDVDAISAKMEDGVLRIEVPKLDAGYVEIKKVDIE